MILIITNHKARVTVKRYDLKVKS